MERLDFDGFDETDFEEFCFHLLDELGFVNLDWRKGTALSTSPADRAETSRRSWNTRTSTTRGTWRRGSSDASTTRRACRRRSSKGCWHGRKPSVRTPVLVICSGFLSNPAKDYLRDYEDNNRPPFRIKYWERLTLERLTSDRRDFLARWLLTGMRSESEILEAEQEFFDRVWYERHLVGRQKHESRKQRMTEKIYKMALEAAERVKARRPDLRPCDDDFEWGMWNGKLSARRWVLGDEWDFLDT